VSTLATIHIQTGDIQETLKLLENYLQQTHRGAQVKRQTTDSMETIYGDDFIPSTDESPRKFAVGSGQGSWVTVHYNSFHDCRDLLAELSRKLNCLVVLVMAQSVSDGYHISVYRAREHLRTLEFADGEWIKQWGKPLPFEQDPLGHNIGSASEPFYVFDDADLLDYCSHFDLNPWESDAESGWTILSVK
jgi:hypothetical protein